MTKQSDATGTESLLEHAGGEEAVTRMDELLYSKVLIDPVLTGLFSGRQAEHAKHLSWFTIEAFGGDDRFTREVGFQHLIDVHRHRNISDEQRQRFVELYMEAADEAGLPKDAPFRQALRSHVEFGASVAQQNSKAKTDAELHPIRSVPRWGWPSGK